ncbi:hypothetical protein GJU39_17180 [Pedobacter petrophilus]|uniref:DUF1735 domain-containing protein n=1 Tax=Pedobacter petrophilus TaxID=1908241 RepID=A0A7K0G1W9_9SPHI|nr:hypothetical protein [Pedobacter petrophilus]MRX77818.1 hypothetical protein [Pedobacter petrophilus]
MEILKNYTKLLLIGSLFLSMSACKKDNVEVPVEQVEINIPGTVSMIYGEQQDITLPANVLGAQDVQITLDFSQNENVKVNAKESLNDKLSAAVTIDKNSGKIHLNSSLLYVNGTISGTNGAKLPDYFKVVVNASSVSKSFQGKQTINLKISPAKLSVKGLDNQAAIPVAYVLYGDAANFELEFSKSSLTGMTWGIENQSSIGAEVSLNANILKFATSSGDPSRKVEKAFNVTPSLQKDGFVVASTAFRVIFIPRIKFFFGTYYPDYDLTILLNNLHIGLSNGYVSAAPTLSPEGYKSTFAIIGIKKDSQVFNDIDALFSINEKTGSVTLKKNSSLTAGAYEITVKAITTTGLEFLTTLTLNMSKVE